MRNPLLRSSMRSVDKIKRPCQTTFVTLAAVTSCSVVRSLAFRPASVRPPPNFRGHLSAAPGEPPAEGVVALPSKKPPTEISEEDCWSMSLALTSKPYVSSLLRDMDDASLSSFLEALDIYDDERDNINDGTSLDAVDPLWEQVKLEALAALEEEPQAGPQLYSLILSQPDLLSSLCTIIANEIETELMPATSIKSLFLEQLTRADHRSVSLDVMAAAMRSPSVGNALNAVLHDRGVHALVCYRVGHRLWLAERKGLAYYMQSTVSSKYSSDIHPACRLGAGIYLRSQGVVIGETAVVGDDTSIMQGVTLGGTGKEAGDRHPKVGCGVILHDSATVLGNIPVGDGAVVIAKSIVTKPVPPLARVSGVPAKIRSYRDGEELKEGALLPDENTHDMPKKDESMSDAEVHDIVSENGDGNDDLERKLSFGYMQQWGDVAE